ncbi:MAG TPA: hypothetical protein VE263_21390 [Candidatus Angelobacter sp.]|nr:hypothetical protein [Candidatus Angelobacter sp.]
MVEQKQLTKGKSALLLVLSAIGAIASATLLHGWHMYAGLAVVGAGILIGFLFWNRQG